MTITTDFSIPVGLSYEMDEAVIDLRYNIGLSNIAKGGIANIVDYKVRNSVIMLTIGYGRQIVKNIKSEVDFSHLCSKKESRIIFFRIFAKTF